MYRKERTIGMYMDEIREGKEGNRTKLNEGRSEGTKAVEGIGSNKRREGEGRKKEGGKRELLKGKKKWRRRESRM